MSSTTSETTGPVVSKTHAAHAAPVAAHAEHKPSTATPAASAVQPVDAKRSVVDAASPHTDHASNDSLHSLVKELQSSGADQRMMAASALGRLGDRAATAPLVTALSDSDADVAHAAAAALGLVGDASAVEPLIAVVKNEHGYFHGVVRIAAIASLRELKEARALEVLQQAIHDPIAEASAEAIRSLAALGDWRAVTPLIEIVRNASGFFAPTARLAAVKGLGQLKGEQAKFELTFVASNQWEDAVIREAAIEALRQTQTVSSK